MKHFVITILGNDRLGIVDQLSSAVKQAGGNWLGSSMSRMAGQFAGILEVTIANDQAESLKSALIRIDDLSIHFTDGAADETATQKLYRLQVTANDRAGIVQDVSHVLNSLSVNVQQLESRCESAPNWGSPLFRAEVTVALPESLDADDLQEQLESIADDLTVDIDRTN